MIIPGVVAASGSGGTPVIPLTVTVSGNPWTSETLTMGVSGGIQDSQRWQSAPYAAGVPSVWTDVPSATATTYALPYTAAAAYPSQLVYRPVATKDGVDYPGDWIGPILPYFNSALGTSSQAVTSISGFGVKGTDTAAKNKIVTNKGGAGVFGVGTAFGSRTTDYAYGPFVELGTGEQRIITTLAGVPTAGNPYCLLHFRQAVTDLQDPDVSTDELRVTVQTNGFFLQEIIDAVNNGAGQTLNTGIQQIGTAAAGLRLKAELLGNKIYLALETGVGTGLYTNLNPGGTVVITLTTTGTGASVNCGTSITNQTWGKTLFEPVAQSVAGASATTADVDFTPSLTRAVLTAAVVGITDPNDLEMRVEVASGGATVFDYAQHADNTITSGVLKMYSATSVGNQSTQLKALVRNKSTGVAMANALFTPVIEATPKTAKYGMNTGFIYRDLPFANLLDNMEWKVSVAGGGGGAGDKTICHPCVTVDNTICESYRDASYVGCDDQGLPHTFPPGSEFIFLSMDGTYDLAGPIPGTYDIVATPGINFTKRGGIASGSSWTLTYDKDTGLGSLVISNSVAPSAGGCLLRLEGFGVGGAYTARTLPAGEWTISIKKASDTGIVREGYKTAFSSLVGAGGASRVMTPNAINRGSVTGVAWNPSNDATPTGDDYKTFTDTMVFTEQANRVGTLEFGPKWAIDAQIELAHACGGVAYLHQTDLYTDGATETAALYFLQNRGGVNGLITNSNEEWNFGAPYRQSTLLNNRALALGGGMTNYQLYARDTAHMWDIWKDVATTNDLSLFGVEPVMEWKFADVTQGILTTMIAEFPEVKHCQFGPYGSNGINNDAGQEVSAQKYVSAFMSTEAWDIVNSNVPQFKTNWNGALSAGNVFTVNRETQIANFLARALVANGLDKDDAEAGEYETNCQHIQLQSGGFSEPTYSAAATALADYMKTSAFGDRQVEHLTRLGGKGGHIVLFDSYGIRSAASIKSGMWSQADRTDAITEHPAAEVVLLAASTKLPPTPGPLDREVTSDTGMAAFSTAYTPAHQCVIVRGVMRANGSITPAITATLGATSPTDIIIGTPGGYSKNGVVTGSLSVTAGDEVHFLLGFKTVSLTNQTLAIAIASVGFGLLRIGELASNYTSIGAVNVQTAVGGFIDPTIAGMSGSGQLSAQCSFRNEASFDIIQWYDATKQYSSALPDSGGHSMAGWFGTMNTPGSSFSMTFEPANYNDTTDGMSLLVEIRGAVLP